ncbi:unnamed protein product [Hydatigera taeniaeformis]|uniref:Dynein light chain n=1 Tax=Hydatigena taeniaeformis TaxID=6205 RepID=A0A0R3WLB7_HYDTA|nr:unnamed protein product [Hydatigera taeniaeformis]
MPTRSLLDAMRSDVGSGRRHLQTTLQEAQSAVARDDCLSLKPLLALPSGEGEGTITEMEFVNPSMEENLLHVRCLRLAQSLVHCGVCLDWLVSSVMHLTAYTLV